jgi:hypothetical protein
MGWQDGCAVGVHWQQELIFCYKKPSQTSTKAVSDTKWHQSW